MRSANTTRGPDGFPVFHRGCDDFMLPGSSRLSGFSDPQRRRYSCRRGRCRTRKRARSGLCQLQRRPRVTGHRAVAGVGSGEMGRMNLARSPAASPLDRIQHAPTSVFRSTRKHQAAARRRHPARRFRSSVICVANVLDSIGVRDHPPTVRLMPFPMSKSAPKDLLCWPDPTLSRLPRGSISQPARPACFSRED